MSTDTPRRRWGRAGVRLTPADEARANVRRHRRVVADQQVRDLWAAGKVVPHRITTALDMQGLYGPEVDEACGATEPDVDMWEAGTLYPTWEQVLALARLTDYPPRFFMMPISSAEVGVDTTLRFHKIGGQRADYRQPPPIRCFTPGAINAMKERDRV